MGDRHGTDLTEPLLVAIDERHSTGVLQIFIRFWRFFLEHLAIFLREIQGAPRVGTQASFHTC